MQFRLVEQIMVESKADQLKLVNHVGQDIADQFFQYKNSLKSPYNDIYYWLKQDKSDLQDYLNNLPSVKRKSREAEIKAELTTGLQKICAMPEANDVEKVAEQDGYEIYKINTPEASVKWGLVVGGRAGWCISGGYFQKNYDSENPTDILDEAVRYFYQYLDQRYDAYYFVFGHGTKYAICTLSDKSSDCICDIWDQTDNEVDTIPRLSSVMYDNELIYQGVPHISDIYEILEGTPENPLKIKVKDGIAIVRGINNLDEKISITEVIIPDGVTEIESGAFVGCRELDNVIIPNSVVKIGEGAFSYCEKLKTITLSNNITEISPYLFLKCESLRNINIPQGIIKIGDLAFYQCASLHQIQLPNSVTEIGENAFESCTSLHQIQLPNSITEIGSHSFDQCQFLKSINIPNSVAKIGDFAFGWCESIRELRLTNVEYIGSWAFQECKSLDDIYLSDNVQQIGKHAFGSCQATIWCGSQRVADLVRRSFYTTGDICHAVTGEILYKAS